MTNDPLLDDLGRRFRYSAWAHRVLAHALVTHAGGVLEVGSLDDPLPRAVLVFGHALRSEAVWHARIHGSAGPVDALWKAVPVDDLTSVVEARALAWTELLEGLDPGGLQRSVSYRNSKGQEFDQPLVDILDHVLNHATHHRGQAVALLRRAGVAPPVTDFIVWAREAPRDG